MHLCISGFLVDDRDDDSLKFELDIPENYESAVMEIMNWTNFAEGCEGEYSLSEEKVEQIEAVLKASLPRNLALYIGVES